MNRKKMGIRMLVRELELIFIQRKEEQKKEIRRNSLKSIALPQHMDL